MNIVVLGAGMVGSAIIKDLAQESDHTVTAVDINQSALDKLQSEAPVKVLQVDLQDKQAVLSTIADYDFVVCAVPGFMGFETIKTIIEAGKDVVDISFFGEDALLLDDLAKEKGVTAVVDCGVAPGLCNIIAGYVYDQLDQTSKYACYVGGLPQIRQWPYEYKAVFSPSDVLEEYTRPARYVEHGQEVVKPALTDPELITYPNVGTLEAFNTDGLRTLKDTLDVPFMVEKTLRYPGHADLMRIFRDSGFFSTTPITVDGQQVKPLSLTSALLFDEWKLNDGEADLTVMQVVLEGQIGSRNLRYTFDLLDRYDEATRTTSMARTTGYTCSIITRQVINGLFTQKGICPPEYVGRTPGCYENLMDEYANRNIVVTETISEG